MANLVDHMFHHLAGILDQVDDGKQDLSIGLADLLDNGGRLAGSASHDMVSFLHGGRLLSDSCLATGFYRIGSQPPPTNLQLNSGPLPARGCMDIHGGAGLLAIAFFPSREVLLREF